MYLSFIFLINWFSFLIFCGFRDTFTESGWHVWLQKTRVISVKRWSGHTFAILKLKIVPIFDPFFVIQIKHHIRYIFIMFYIQQHFEACVVFFCFTFCRSMMIAKWLSNFSCSFSECRFSQLFYDHCDWMCFFPVTPIDHVWSLIKRITSN